MTQPGLNQPDPNAPPVKEQWEPLRDDGPDLPDKVEKRLMDAFPPGAARAKLIADAKIRHPKKGPK